MVAEAEAAGVKLQAPAFNSLLVCAGRSGQLGRAFEVLDMMADRGVRPDAMTYGSLVEACVMASRQELALKIFHNALREVNRSGIGGGGGREGGGGGVAGGLSGGRVVPPVRCLAPPDPPLPIPFAPLPLSPLVITMHPNSMIQL